MRFNAGYPTLGLEFRSHPSHLEPILKDFRMFSIEKISTRWGDIKIVSDPSIPEGKFFIVNANSDSHIP